MRLTTLLNLGMSTVFVICGAVTGDVVLNEWRGYSAGIAACRAARLLELTLAAHTKLSFERGPTNGGLGAEVPLSESRRKALSDARAATDKAMADAAAAASQLPEAAARDARQSIETTVKKLTAVRLQADAIMALPPKERSSAAVSGVVTGMIAAIPELDTALNKEEETVIGAVPELVPWVTILRSSTELRDFAGQVGSVFTAALAGKRPLNRDELTLYEHLNGHVDGLLRQIDLAQTRLGPDPGLQASLAAVSARYFGPGRALAAEVVRKSLANEPYGMSTADFAAKYVPEMGSIVTFREAVFARTFHLLDQKLAARRASLIAAATVAAVLLTVVLGIAVLFRSRVSKPLKRAADVLERMSRGELDAPIPLPDRQDEIGEVSRAIVQLRDVSREMARSQLLLQSVFKYARDAIYISKWTDTSPFYVAMCNPAGARAAGLTQEEIIGKTARDLYGQAGGERVESDLRRVVSSGEPMEYNYYLQDAGRYYEGVHFPLRGADGKIDSVFTTTIDVTERRRIDRMKSEFIATVSHELRTPLTAIAGALGLIVGGTAGQLGGKAGRLLKIAHDNVSRLVRLVNDILDIEKIEAGRMEFSIQPIDLKTAVTSALNGLTEFAKSYGVGLKFEDNGLAPKVNADDDRLAQVITNIVSNAVKFSPRGEAVTVALKPSDFQDCVRMTVTDRGPGIPEDFQPRLFMKFSQADNSDRRLKGGTGLGLCICKEITERLGGHISFDSVEGAGTSFHVDLPLAAANGASGKTPFPYGEAI